MPNYCDATCDLAFKDSFQNISCGDLNSDDELYSLSFDLGASNITTTYNDNTITFSWEENAYTIVADHNYYSFGFNRFDLILLDKSYNQVFVKEDLTENSYTIKESDWKQITIFSYGYIYLKAYDKHGGVSGPYVTSYYRFTILDNLKPIIIPDFKVGNSIISNN